MAEDYSSNQLSAWTSDLTGLRVGILTVIRLASKKHQRASWLCQCDCGREKVVLAQELKRSLPGSCGCKTKEQRKASISRAARIRREKNPQWVAKGDVAEIDFGKGRICVVDITDLPVVAPYRWHVHFSNNRKMYAGTASAGKILMHVLIMGRKGIDHRDGNGLNNRRDNLRFATSGENQANQRKQANTKSRFKGVRVPGKERAGWAVEITCKNVRYHLGTYLTEEDAARAYDRKAVELFGKFAHLNFPDENKRD